MPTALVVDDDPSIRELFSLTLEHEGWSVTTAFDGQDALDKLGADAECFDVVLLDMMMPRVTGMQVLERMMADGRLRKIPRIVISAKEDSLERKFALELGAAAWLSKPVSFQRIVDAVEQHRSDVIDADVVPTHWVPESDSF